MQKAIVWYTFVYVYSEFPSSTYLGMIQSSAKSFSDTRDSKNYQKSPYAMDHLLFYIKFFLDGTPPSPSWHGPYLIPSIYSRVFYNLPTLLCSIHGLAT